MIYRITIDDINVYGETPDTVLINPKVELELNSAGSCSFTMPLYHQYYDLPQLLNSIVKVYEDNDLIFFGRIISLKTTFNKQKEIYCEGALAYFNDSIQRPREYKEILLRDFFSQVIQNHNSQVEADRRFVIGNVTIPDKYVYRKLNYESTWSVLTSMCLDTDGGYIFADYVEGHNRINWYKDMPYRADQPVQYALNLIDMTQDINGADICTRVIPLGRYDAAENEVDPPEYLTIEDKTGGFDYIENDEAKVLYGNITKVKTYNDISNLDKLYDTAALWLQDEQYDKLVLECEAAELHYIDGSYHAFKVGQSVNVKSTPHLIDVDLPLSKMSLELDSGVKKITIGTAPRKTLTEITAPESNSSSGGSSGGSGGSGGSSGNDTPVLDIQEITDDWDTIVSNRGTKYNIGNFKILETGDPIIGTIRMQKVATNEDSSETTWVAMNTSKGTIKHYSNPNNITDGGVIRQEMKLCNWYNSNIREYLNNTLLNTLPPSLRNGIVLVKKYSATVLNASQISKNYTTRDKIWIPSYYEFFGDPTAEETVGMHYPTLGEGVSLITQYENTYSYAPLLRSKELDITQYPNSSMDTRYCYFSWPRIANNTYSKEDGGYYSRRYSGSDYAGYVIIGFCL